MLIQMNVEVDCRVRSVPSAAVPDDAEDVEALLIARSVAGDNGAFTELISRHSRVLYGAVYRITKHHEDAEDVVQEAILKAYKHLRHFEHRSQFRSWLVRIGMNQALMCLRQKRRCVISSSSSVDGGDDWYQQEVAEDGPSLDDLVLQGELHHRLQHSIQRLPATLGIVASLRFVEELSVAQMASALRISESAVKSRLLRARRQLAKTLLHKTAYEVASFSRLPSTVTEDAADLRWADMGCR